MAVTIHKKLPEDITGTKLLYKYKDIRIYRLRKNNNHFLSYWVAILLVNENRGVAEKFYRGKLLPCVDIRTFPTWNKNAHEVVLAIESSKLIPKLFRDALRLNAIPEDAYVEWSERDDEYLIWEI